MHRWLPYAAEDLSTAGCRMLVSPVNFQLLSAGSSTGASFWTVGCCSPPSESSQPRYGQREAASTSWTQLEQSQAGREGGL